MQPSERWHLHITPSGISLTHNVFGSRRSTTGILFQISLPVILKRADLSYKMKAIIKAAPHPGLEMASASIPSPGNDDVLIKIRAVSVCGTDLHIYKWNDWAQMRIKRLPLILGHEFAGEVADAGRSVRNVSVGDYVSADSHVVCGRCLQCRIGQQHICGNLEILGVDRDGCFAEYVSMPARGVWKNDPDVPPEFASVQDPLGNAVYCTLVEPVAGKSVMIIGDGPTGLFSAGIARVSGASWIGLIGHHQSRMDVATKMGADSLFHGDDPELEQRVMDITCGNGADVVLEMSGSEKGLMQGLRILRKGGRISLFGLFPDPVRINLTNQVIFKGITMYGINGRIIFDTWERMHNLLKSGRLDISPVITHKLAFDDFEKGFGLLMDRPKKAVKVVLNL